MKKYNPDEEMVPVYQEEITVKQMGQPQEQIIHVCLKDGKGNIIVADEPDAISMSQAFPEERIITVYHNGIPETMSVNQLIKEAMLSVKGEVEG